VFNILDLIAEFGGLSSTIMQLGIAIGFFINSRIHIEALIQENYFLKLSDNLDNSDNLWKRF